MCLYFLQELELLPAKDLYQNIYIKHPVSIEQYLMEGSYNKVDVLRILISFAINEKSNRMMYYSW